MGDESLLNGIVFVMCHTFNPATCSRAVRQVKSLTTCPAPQRKNPPRPAPRLQQAKYSKIFFRCSAPEQPSLTGVILGNLRGGRVLKSPPRERVFFLHLCVWDGLAWIDTDEKGETCEEEVLKLFQTFTKNCFRFTIKLSNKGEPSRQDHTLPPAVRSTGHV